MHAIQDSKTEGSAPSPTFHFQPVSETHSGRSVTAHIHHVATAKAWMPIASTLFPRWRYHMANTNYMEGLRSRVAEFETMLAGAGLTDPGKDY